jgi:hypothetical protein
VVAVSSFRFALPSFFIVLRLIRLPRFERTAVFSFAAMSVCRFLMKLMKTNCGLFFARLLHLEKRQKCVIFGDQSPVNWSKEQRLK